MMEKPKKERKFLKILGKFGEILVQELLLKVGRSLVQKIGGKKTLPSIIFLSLFYNIAFASIDSIPYPITGNKQRLGWQTTGNGLVYRGRASDTITKPSNYANKDIKAYLLVDTINNVLYNYIASKGGWKFNNSDTVIIQGVTMPFDSITFNIAKDGTVGVGEVEYNDTQGSLIQGLKGGNVTNVIGQQLHQRVNNKTGGTLSKGTVVYLSGSQGNRITVAKALATSDPTSANTFGIVAEEILDNASGYVITEGLITNINTSALTQDSAVYLSGTTAGALTSTKPQAPIHGVYIGVCVKSNAGSGELFVKIRNGQELDELHDVVISSPVDRASLYYKSSEGLWRDTTAALLVSDTATMLTPYLRKLDTLSLSNRINLKLNISDTLSMLSPYFRDADTTSLNLTSRFATKLNTSDTSSMLTNYLRTGTAASTYVPLNTESTINATLNINGNLNINTGGTVTTPILSAGSIIKQGGTSSQFLKADGSTDSNTYLTTSSAASTYLPLTGGTLSGNLNLSSGILNTWTSAYSSAPRNDGSISRGYFQNLRNSSGNYGNVSRVIHNYMFSQDELTAAPQTFYYGRLNGFYAQDYNAASASIIYDASIYYHNTNQFYYRAYSEPEDKITWSIKPATTVNTISGTRANMYLSGSETIDGSSTIGGTLGVTGFSTFSTGAIINENSNDSDTRIESDGNANMVFVDASTDRVGIGTSSPSKTLDVNGTLNVSGATTLGSTLAVTGNIAAGLTSATAALNLKAGTSSASSAPLKFTSGTNMTTAEAGAMEFNGTNLFFSPSTTRHTVNHGLTGSREIDFLSTSGEGSSDETITVTGASEGDVVSLGVPNDAVMSNTCYTAWVSAANTVTVRFNNYSSSLKNPNPGVFKVFVTK